jgi:hypothetical protein
MGRTLGSRLAVVGRIQKVIKPWEDWDDIDGFLIIASAYPPRRRGKNHLMPTAMAVGLKHKKRGRPPKKKRSHPAKPKHRKTTKAPRPALPPSPPVLRVMLRLQPAPPTPPPPEDKPVSLASWRKEPARKMLEEIMRERATPVERVVVAAARARSRPSRAKKQRPCAMQLPWATPPPPQFQPRPVFHQPEPNMLAMGEVDLVCWETMPPHTP